MANPRHVAFLKEGVEAWNRWRKENDEEVDLGGAWLEGANLIGINLSRANLRGANLLTANCVGADLNDAELGQANLRIARLAHASLIRANLLGANLAYADLTRADLRHAKLGGTILSRARLPHANLARTDLCGADLSMARCNDADFSSADISRADFTGARVRGANFHRALVGYTRFGNCDLGQARGLDQLRHLGPSTVGIDTIYQSKGTIAEAFLRQCGVPDGFIMQMTSLIEAEEGIQFYSCFLSYCAADEEFAYRLQSRLRDSQLRVWFAPEDMKAGDVMHRQIETAIRLYDKLLVVLSDASLKSEWVKTELLKARKVERERGHRKLFPVRLLDFKGLQAWECIDPDTGEDVALEVRSYFIPDFSNWQDDDKFESAASRLISHLRNPERLKDSVGR